MYTNEINYSRPSGIYEIKIGRNGTSNTLSTGYQSFYFIAGYQDSTISDNMWVTFDSDNGDFGTISIYWYESSEYVYQYDYMFNILSWTWRTYSLKGTFTIHEENDYIAELPEATEDTDGSWNLTCTRAEDFSL